MKRLCMLALVCLAAVAAGGQEFDIFELSDFMDPRIRGVRYAENGLETKIAGDTFVVSRISVGAISDYYWRTTPTGANVAVLHNATSFYWGANQLNLKVTKLATRHENVLMPELRGAVQFARYTARESPITEGKEGAPDIIVSRYLVGLSVEETPDALEDLKGQRALNYEVAAEVDVRLPWTDILGTFSYIKRYAGVGESTQRFAYVVHSGQHSYSDFTVDFSLALGAEKTGNWRWGDVRPAAHARLPIDKVGTVVHLAYAPTVSFEGGFAVRHEVAVFVDRTLFARVLGARPAPTLTPASIPRSR